MPLKSTRAATAFILVTAALDVLAFGLIIPVLPTLIEEFAGSQARAGIWNGVLVALWAAAQFFASPVIGSLSDRFGRRPVILVSVAGMAVDWVLMAVAPNLWWLVVGRLLAGVTSSSFTTVYAYLADITPPEQRARSFGLVGAAFSGGFVLGPFLGGVLGEISPRAPFWAAAAMSGVAFVYGWLILPESLAKENRTPFSWRRANPFGSLRLLRSRGGLLRLTGVYFLFMLGQHVYSAVYVLYATHRYGLSTLHVGLLLGMWGALEMVVQTFMVGPTAARFGERRAMVAGLVFGAVGLAGMGLATTALGFMLMMLPGALMSLAMPTAQSLMTQRVSEAEQGQLQGASMSVASIAGVVSPVFFGTIYAMSVGERALIPYVGTAFLIAAGVLLGAALLGAPKGSSQDGHAAGA